MYLRWKCCRIITVFFKIGVFYNKLFGVHVYKIIVVTKEEAQFNRNIMLNVKIKTMVRHKVDLMSNEISKCKEPNHE